jgi:hypothetical protein
MNKLDINPPRRNESPCQGISNIKTALQRNGQLRKLQLLSNNMTHFPVLGMERTHAAKSYITEFHQQECQFLLSRHLQVYGHRFISVQFDRNMRNIFRHAILLDFHKFCLPGDKFPVLSHHAWRMTSLFGSTYISEQCS